MSGLVLVSLACSTLVCLSPSTLFPNNQFNPSVAWYMQGDYLYPVLIVAFDQSVLSATRISSLYSFASVLTGTALGVLVIRVRRLKPFLVFGSVLFLVA